MSIASINTTLKINKNDSNEDNNVSLFSKSSIDIGNKMKTKRKGDTQDSSQSTYLTPDTPEPRKKKLKLNKTPDNTNDLKGSDASNAHTISSSHSLLSALHEIHSKSKSSPSSHASLSSSSKKTSNVTNQSAALKATVTNSRNNQPGSSASLSHSADIAAKRSQNAESFKQSQNHAASIDSGNVYVNNRTIYVEGLPFGSNEDEVRSFFQESCRSSHGSIVSVRLPTWHDSGRLKGYGHVEFSSAEGALQAFDLDGCDYLDTGRFIKIASPKVPHAISAAAAAAASTTASGKKNTVGCRTVFIKNLPYDASDAEIREVFQVCAYVYVYL